MTDIKNIISWRYITSIILAVIVYLILALISGRVLSVDVQLPTLWFPAGFTLSLVLLGGYRYLPVAAIGVILTGLLREQPLPFVLLYSLSNVLTLWVAVHLLTAIFKINKRLHHVKDYIVLVLVGGFGSMAIGATIVIITLLLAGTFTPAQVLNQFIILWVGSSLSVIFITPLMSSWLYDRSPFTSRHKLYEMIGLWVCTHFFAWIAFSNVLHVDTTIQVVYITSAVFLWAIMRFGLHEVALINTTFVAYLLFYTHSPYGLVYALPTSDQLIFTYSFIGIESLVVFALKLLIDDRNRMERTLRKERDNMSQILNTMGQGVTVLNKDGLYEYVNPAFEKLVGRSREELIGTSPLNVLADSFKPELQKIFELRKLGRSSTYQALLKHIDGTEIKIMTTGVPRISNGQHQGSISVVTDIRPIIEAQEAQRVSEDRYRKLFENMDIGMFRYNPDGGLYAVNKRLAKLVGVASPQALIDTVNQKTHQFYVNPKRRADFYTHLYQNGQVSDFESELILMNGTKIWVSESAYAVYDEDGEVLYYEGTVLDITPRKLAEQDLKRSEAQFRQIFENSQIGMYRTTPAGDTLLVNPYMAQLHGYDSPEAMLSDYSEATPARYVNPLRRAEFVEKLNRDGHVVDFESAVYRSDLDDVIWVSESAYAITDDHGEIVYYEGFLIDITRQKHYEQEVQRSETFFRTLFEQSAESIIVLDNNGYIVMANPAHQELVGYTIDELKTMKGVDYIHPDDKAREEKLFNQAIQSKDDNYHLQLRFVCKDGTIRWADHSVSLVWDDKGNHQQSIAMNRDITDMREAQTAIENSEKRFRAIFEHARLPISVTRDDRTLEMVNPAFCKLLGYTEDELRLRKFDEISYPADNEKNIHLYEQLIKGEIETFTLNKRYIHRDRSIIWTNVSVSRFEGHIVANDENHIYTIAIVENITERKLAEDRLMAEVSLNEQLIDALPGIFYFFNPKGDLLRWNKALEQVSGFSSSEIQNAQLLDFFPYESHQLVRDTIKQVYQDGYAVTELPIMHRDQTTTPYLVNGYHLQINGENCILGVGIDISHLKATELALRESEERHRSLFENSLVGMFRTTLDGRYLSANPALVHMLGYESEEELFELDITKDVYAYPDERERQMNRVQVVDDVINEHTVHLKRKDGVKIVASVRAKTMRDPDGNTIYFEGSIIDITEKHRYDEEIQRLNAELAQRVEEATAELRVKNKQLMELDRLRAKFIADMSHEMRTPLAVLNTRIYLMKHNKDKNFDRHIEGLQIQLQRLEEFVENAFDLSLIDMSRQNVQFKPVDFNKLVEKAVIALAPRAEVAGLDLSYELASSVPEIVAVEGYLSQVATNLIGNAIKYTEAGYVKVTTGVDSLTQRIFLRVEDSGMGIAAEDMQYLFSRFYRGERAGQSTIPGTGLGLSIVQEIVDMHGGHIDVESEVNDGTIFTVWFLQTPNIEGVSPYEDNDATVGE